MLNYLETIEKIKNIKGELIHLEEKTNHYNYRSTLKTLYENEKMEEIKTLEAEFDKNVKRLENLKCHLKVYQANAEKLFILENINKIFEIVNTYQGKKCGVKTLEKIRESVSEACNCGITLDNSSGITLYNRNTYLVNSTINVYCKYINGENQKIFNDENKINRLEAENFHLPDINTIIDDVEEYTEQKTAEFLQLKELYQALQEATEKYNKNNPFKHQYIRDGITWMN